MQFITNHWRSSGRFQPQTIAGTLLNVISIKISYPVIACADTPALFTRMEAAVFLGCNQRVWAPISALPEAFCVTLVVNLG